LEDIVAQLFASQSPSDPAVNPEFSSPLFTAKRRKPSAEDHKRLKMWEDWAATFRIALDNEFSVQDINFNVEFEIESIHQDGLFVGHYCIEDEEKLRFFANLNPGAEQPRLGCECFASLGTEPCIHTFTFLDWLYEVIDNPDFEIYKAIVSSQFKVKKPDLSSLSKLDTAKVSQLLNQKAPLPAEISDPLKDVSALEQVDVATAQRLCWDLKQIEFQPHFQLRIQQPKKRGGGWTKGKRVSCSNLLSAVELANDTDKKIISRLTDHSLFYGRSLELPLGTTCFDLLGQDNVTIEGKPASIKRFQPAAEYFENETHCGVRLKLPAEQHRFFVVDRKNLIAVLPEDNEILIASCTEEVATSIHSLVDIPSLPLSASPQLVEHLQAFRTVLPIELPPTKNEIEQETTTPVILLRSREDGVLDYGLRLRGSRGDLYKPGEGPLLVTGKSSAENGKGEKNTKGQKKKQQSYNVLRSLHHELQQGQQTLELLGLPAQKLEGSIGDFEEAIELLQEAQELESKNAIEVLWDKSSVSPVRVLGAVTPKNLRVNIGKSRDWLQLNGQADLQFGSLELSDLLRGLEDASTIGDYVKFGDKGWAKVSRRLRRQLAKISNSVHQDRKKLTFDATSVPVLQEILGEHTSLKTSKQWDDCVNRMEAAQQLQPVVPAELKAELRGYQREGFDWLRRLAEWQVGGILADDMGLGKTLQALAVILDRAQEGPVLIVAPTSVGFNWQSEAERFAPDLNVYLYRESNRSELLERASAGDVVICSYGLMLRDADLIAATQWSTLVLDEAQAVKNSRSKTAIAAKSIPAQWKLALTGTPMENHLGELWSIFHVVAPGVFGGWENFRKRYALPIERGDDESRRIALRERIQPFVLRRKKSDVLHDLPPRHDQNIVVELSDEERKIYDTARATALLEADEIAALSDVKDQRFRLLALLTRLRQLACSPKMVDEQFDKRSSKLVQLAETLQQLHREGHRVLIFSQFVKHLHLIRDMLTEEEISFEYLDGSTSAKARKESVNRFQQGNATAFLISLKAGGTGLNLTAADYVIHMDPWWNPAVEDQATDRAHRIGQTKSVMCYRFVAKQTIEEEILKLHESKRDLVAGVLEGSATAAKLSTEDLIAMIRKRD